MKIQIIACAALLAAGCAQEPVRGKASPELMERVDRGEFKAYEVDPNSCAAIPPDRRKDSVVMGSCPSEP